VEQRFTRSEVQRMTGTTLRQLEYWSRLGLVRPRSRWGERFYSFADLVVVETLGRLAVRKIPVRRLCRAIDAFERHMGRARAPLASLSISTNGSEIVVHEPGPDGRPIEPLTGQFVLNFDVTPLEKKVRALAAQTAEHWFELGMASDASPETYPEAVDAYRRAIEAAPDWVEAYINLGTALYHLDRFEESREAFATAVGLEPMNALAYFNLGCVYDRLGSIGAAVDNFRAALGRAPQMADAHLNLALAYEKMERKREASRHLSLYLRYEPRGPWADFVRTRLAAERAEPRQGKVTPFRSVRR
jgi:DNA-binding transcriptional MerR regulator